MWHKVRPLLIILSIALNMAFVGTWIVGSLRQKALPGHGARCGTGEIWRPLHRRLGLSDAQWREIEPRMRAFHDSTRARCGRMRALRSELIDLLAADRPDREAITAQQEAILAGQREMQERVIAHLLAEKQALTTEQQKKFFQMIRQRSGCAPAGNAVLCPDSTPGERFRTPTGSRK